LKLQRSGKIGYVGVSNFNVFQQRLLSSYLSQPIITNHIEFNLLQSEALRDGRLDFIKEQHSRVLAFSPLADGRILLGEDEKAVRVRKVLQEIARKYDANVEQTAVAWVHKLGALPIIGSKETRRIQNASTAYDINLSKEDWYTLYNETIR
jgi:predicted oxidoreductase